MIEQWKDIKGYEGLYQVSNMGNVKSLHGRYGIKERILKFSFNGSSGYYKVRLYKNKKIGIISVARLVGEAFLKKENEKLEINHIDGNVLNNRVDNLEWVTHSQNIKHAYDTGLMKPRYKPVLMLSLDNKPLLWFDSIKEASDASGILHQCISACCHKKTKTAGGYKWKFNNE